MTMEGITFNLGLGTSPCVVTIADASGLVPLELPGAFAVDRQQPRPPSDDAVCRFEAALSAGASPADAQQAIQILRGIVPAPAVPSSEPIAAERPAPPVAPAAAETPAPVETPVASRTPVVAETPVAVERPVVAEAHVAVEMTVVDKTPVPAAMPTVVPSAKTVELVAKPEVARAPSPLQQGRGGLATPNTHGFANASVGAARTAVTVETPVAEIPVSVERPVVVEAPVIDKVPVPTETSVITPSAEPATQEAVAKPDVARAPSPLQQGRGGLATPNMHGSANASVGAAKSVVTAETPVAEIPVIVERPAVVETPVVVQPSVFGKVPVPTAAPSVVPSAEPVNQEAVAKPGRDGVPPPSAAGDGTPALPGGREFATASQFTGVNVEKPAVIERPSVIETPTVALPANRCPSFRRR